jgi:hypothetical protein
VKSSEQFGKPFAVNREGRPLGFRRNAAQTTPASQIKVTLYNRSRKVKKVLAYSYFKPDDTPAGFLPELSAVDMSSKSTLPLSTKGKKGGPPAVHIHRHRHRRGDGDHHLHRLSNISRH